MRLKEKDYSNFRILNKIKLRKIALNKKIYNIGKFNYINNS